MFCNKCSIQNNQGEIYCKQCGMKLENSNQFIQPQQNTIITQQETNNGMYKLTINRPKEFICSLVKFKIYVDGNKVGELKNGETITLNVTAGNHIISINKTIDHNLNIISDTYADTMIITNSKFVLTNIRDKNGQIMSQNNNLNTDNDIKLLNSAKTQLVFSIICIIITFILLFTIQMVVQPGIYAISIGFSIVNIISSKKQKQNIKEKYDAIIKIDITSIIVSIIGIFISGFLMLG